MNMLCVRFWICKEAGEEGKCLLNDYDDIKSKWTIHNERLNSYFVIVLSQRKGQMLDFDLEEAE